MRTRATAVAITMAAFIAACSNSTTVTPSTLASEPAASPSVAASPSPGTASPSPLAGGCGDTQVYAGPGPDNTPGLEQNPWAWATPADAGILAFFWYPPPGVVFASTSSYDAPKVLWVSQKARRAALTISARPATAESPLLRFEFPEAESPVGNYPSGIEIPTPGCWHLDLTIGTAHATMDLLVATAR